MKKTAIESGQVPFALLENDAFGLTQMPQNDCNKYVDELVTACYIIRKDECSRTDLV